MNDTLMLILAWAVGVWLGAIFFGGLWWTVRKGLSSRRPALLFVASLLLRMGMAIAGIYWVGREIGQLAWQPLLLCLLGFVLARPLVLRLTATVTEIRHAS